MTRTNKILLIIIVILLLAIGFILINSSDTTNNARAIVYVNDIGVLNPGGTLDSACSVWCGRLYAFGILMLSFAALYGYYAYKIALIDARIDLAEIEKEREVLQTKTLVNDHTTESNVRIIPFNTTKSVNRGNDIALTDGLTIPKAKLIEFVTTSMRDDGPGLAIGRWKKEGWDQELVEGLLDYMYSLGIVTERTNGRVCTYIDVRDPTEVLKKISNA